MLKVRLHDATKLMRYATCDKIALCKRAYLCDMWLLHAVAGKLKSSNFLPTACRNKPVYIVRFRRTSHVAWSHVFVASCKRALTFLTWFLFDSYFEHPEILAPISSSDHNLIIGKSKHSALQQFNEFLNQYNWSSVITADSTDAKVEEFLKVTQGMIENRRKQLNYIMMINSS